ncbi:MAG: protease pro-enzyme activation domain-containing protein, partial [Solirubrobacterales bacterium]
MRAKRVLLAFAAFLLVAGTASAGGTQPAGDGGSGIDYRDRGPVAGVAPDSTRIDLVLLLDADDRALARDALAVSSPGSSDFRRYLEPGQIARRYGADRSAIRRVISHLEDRGIEARPGIGGMWVEADPTIRQAELLFSTELGSFSSDGERFVAPTRQPKIPEELLPEVTGVVGLDTEPITE